MATTGTHSPIPERLLSRLWQRRAARQRWFRTHGGARVRVIYPGRPARSAGPDFRGALLEMEGVGLVQGDVEIHLRQQDWQAHGHGGDPRYNGVVLHAALEVQSPSTNLRSGRQVPVVSLAPLMADEAPETGRQASGLWRVLAQRGYPRPHSAAGMAALLDRAGDQRFLAKSHGFQRFLAEQSPDQTLYEGLMEGLGYHQNQHPFLQLAQRASYRALVRAASQVPAEGRAAAIEAWLAKSSGLLSVAQSRAMPRPPTGLGAPLSAKAWQCFRVRPANHPLRRVAGAAGLVARFWEPGLVAGLRAAAGGKPAELTSALTVPAEPGSGGAPIGLGRARDLAVNVVLPFLHGLATREEELESARSYSQLYQRFGKLQSNELTGEMAEQLLEPDWLQEVATARRQQGLLHLHHLISSVL